MQNLYDQNLVASFISWFDWTLLTRGNAFDNISGIQLWPIPCDITYNQYVYAAPYKPFLADVSVTGGIVPSGFYDANGNFLTRASGITINFEGGYITSPTPLAAPLSGNFSLKEYCLQYENEAEDFIISQTDYSLKPDIAQIPTGLPYNVKTVPFIAVKYNPGENVPFQFGGTDTTQSEFRALVMSDSAFFLDGILGIFRDCARSNFSLLQPNQLAFDSLGDYKNGVPWNYPNQISTTAANIVYISRVQAYKLSEAAATKIGQKLYVGMIDFNVEIPREVKRLYPQ